MKFFIVYISVAILLIAPGCSSSNGQAEEKIVATTIPVFKT